MKRTRLFSDYDTPTTMRINIYSATAKRARTQYNDVQKNISRSETCAEGQKNPQEESSRTSLNSTHMIQPSRQFSILHCSNPASSASSTTASRASSSSSTGNAEPLSSLTEFHHPSPYKIVSTDIPVSNVLSMELQHDPKDYERDTIPSNQTRIPPGHKQAFTDAIFAYAAMSQEERQLLKKTRSYNLIFLSHVRSLSRHRRRFRVADAGYHVETRNGRRTLIGGMQFVPQVGVGKSWVK